MSIKLTLGDDRCCSDKPSLRLPYYHIRRYASRLFLLAGFHFFALHLIYRTHCSKDRDGSRICQVPWTIFRLGFTAAALMLRSTRMCHEVLNKFWSRLPVSRAARRKPPEVQTFVSEKRKEYIQNCRYSNS
ncbi:hypothetical protein P692DRAFT_20362066 [Suillus brevipes Sb2]|nr:hypothetical protein P692DRAFT_20362066 [Suillus brevipes Sb2]